MEDPDEAVLESVLAVIDDPFAGLDDDTSVDEVPLADVMEKLEERHEYDEDELERSFYWELTEVMDQCRSYQKTDNYGLPVEPLSVFRPQSKSICSTLGQ